jgi:hypothetical protein
MAQRDRLAGALGGQHAGHARQGKHVALGQGARRDLLPGRLGHAHVTGRARHAACFHFVAHVHHARGTARVQVRERLIRRGRWGSKRSVGVGNGHRPIVPGAKWAHARVTCVCLLALAG